MIGPGTFWSELKKIGKTKAIQSEYSSRNPESLLRLESGIQIPLTNRPESNIWNPESKTVLEFLIPGVTNGTSCLRLSNRDIRALTILQRRRPWKPYWKIGSESFQTISRLSQVAQLLKRREFMLELKRGCRTRVQTEMVEFNALPFPSSKTLKILAISRRSRAGTVRKCTKKAWVVVFLTKLIAFWCCRCRRRRSFVRSLLRSDDGKLRRRFWVTDYFSLLWVTDPFLNENACKITQSCNYLPLTS